MALSNHLNQRRQSGLLNTMESLGSEFDEVAQGGEVVSPMDTIHAQHLETRDCGNKGRMTAPRSPHSPRSPRSPRFRARNISEPLKTEERRLDRERAISVSVAEVSRSTTAVNHKANLRTQLRWGSLSEIPEDELSKSLRRLESFRDIELPETRLENLMIGVKQSGLPKETIFASVAPPDKDQISVDQWFLALKNINRAAFFPLEYEECQEIARLLFHFPQPGYEEGFVHCSMFKDWCYNIKHLSWRAEKRRRKSSEFQLFINDQQNMTHGVEKKPEEMQLNLNGVLSKTKTAEDAPLGHQIFRAFQFFWRTRTSLQVTIHLNSEFGIVSMVFIDEDTGQVFPTLKIDGTKVPIPHEKMQERCLKKFGPSKLKLFEQETGIALYENPEYQRLLAQQGKQEASARQELLAEYLISRISMPSPVELQADQGRQGPYLQKQHGDEWDTLLIENPKVDPAVKPQLRKRGTSMEEFSKCLQDLHTARSDVSKHTDSARQSIKQVDIAMKTLSNLSQSSQPQKLSFGESGWARQKWKWAFRLIRKQLQLEKARARLRTLPAYQIQREDS